MPRIPVRARRLADRLRALRERAGLTHEDLVPHVDHKQAWCSKVERCQVRIRLPDVKAWATACGLAPGDTGYEALVALARDAWRSDPGWWDAYRDGDNGNSTILDYVEWEASATTYQTLEDCVVPGLLQTPDYATAIERSTSTARPEEIERVVEMRMRRQDRLTGSDPLTVWAVISQEVTERPIGGPRVLTAQLQRLMELAELPHVTLQIMPRDSHSQPGVGGRVALLGFADHPGLDVAYLDTLAGGLCIEAENTVRQLARQLRLATACALSPSESADLLAKKIKENDT